MYKNSTFSIRKKVFTKYSTLVYAALLTVAVAVWVGTLIFDRTTPVYATHAAPLVRDQVSVTIDKSISSKQVTKPTTQTGDLLVLILAADSGDHTGTVLPAGFTEIGRNSLGTGRLHYLVGTKVAGSSEPSTYSLTVPTGSDAMASLISIQNADTTSQPIITKTNTLSSATTHITPKVTPKGSSDLLLSTVALDSVNPALLGANSWTPALGMTEVVDQQYSSEMSMTVAKEALNNGGDAGVRTFTASATSANPGLSYSLAIKGMSDMSAQVVPNSLVSGATWTGTLDYTRIDEGQTLDGLYVNTGAATGETSVTYNMSTVTGVYDATGLTLNMCIYSTAASGTIVDDITPHITIRGQTIAGTMFKPVVSSSQCSWRAIEFTGLWGKADIDGLQISFTRTVQGTNNKASNNVDDIRIDSAYVDITRTPTVSSVPATDTNPVMRAISSINQSSTVVNKSVAVPSYQEGDLMVAILSADNGLMTDMSLPAGFTEIGWLDHGPNQLHVKVGTKAATASEPASYNYAAATNADTRIDVISVVGADVSVVPKVTRYMTPSSDSNHAAPGVIPHASNDLLLSAIAINPIENLGTTWSSNNAWMLEISDMQTDNKLSMMAASQSLTTSNPSGLKGFLTTTTSVTSGAAISLSIKGASVPSLLDQSTYRFYESSGTATAGVPLAAQNTPITVAPNTSFRLRQLLHQSSGTTNSGAFKLQSAQKASTCSEAAYGDLSTVFDTDAGDVMLSDDFSTADITKWEGWNSATVINQGMLELTLNDMYDGELVSSAAYDLTGASAQLEVIQGPNAGSGSTELSLILRDTANPDDQLQILLTGDSLEMIEWSNGSGNVTSITYSSTAHRYWRIREAAGVIYWETSPDGSTWTIQRQMAFTIPSVTSMKPAISTGYWNTEANPGLAIVDNFMMGKPINDETALVTTVDDPVPANGAVFTQTFSKNVDFGLQQVLYTGENGLWEFGLKADAALDGKTYCFRVVKSDGSALASYSQYPEVTFASPTTGPTLDQQMRGGQAVVNGEKKPFNW